MKKYRRSRKSIKIQRFRQLNKNRLPTNEEVYSRQKIIREDKKSDYQIEWEKVITDLAERSIVKWQQVSFLSVMGDAPKDFITDREERILQRTQKISFDRYIAKVGSKFFPPDRVNLE